MIKSPILIVGCARSGTSLLYHVLSEAPELWSIGVESKAIIEHHHHPAVKGWESGELTAGDLTADSRDRMLADFAAQAAPGVYWQRVNAVKRMVNRSALYAALKRRGQGDASGAKVSSALPEGGLALFRAGARLRNRVALPGAPIRLLDKSPEHCLRLPFLAALFPDARVLFITRNGRDNVHSLMEGWRQPHLFPGYQTPLAVTGEGQTRGRWAFTLIPGWQELADRPLEEICAHQWSICNRFVLDYAASPGALPMLAIRYEAMIADPAGSLERIARFLDLLPERIPAYRNPLPEVNVVSAPGTEKWRRESAAIARVEPVLRPMMTRLGYVPKPDADHSAGPDRTVS